MKLFAITILFGLTTSVVAFQPALPTAQQRRNVLPSSLAATASTSTASTTEASVTKLKKVLEREYLSFFNPMERSYYADSVTFDDPLTKLEGVDGYQKNVDMLAGRTLMGSFLFKDASINLHSVTGGKVVTTTGDDNKAVVERIEDITTRWTLRFTFKALPWSPTARFSGISVYTVAAGGTAGVQILKQADYWDSINLQPAGGYKAVDKSVALKHFIDQIKPGNFEAPSAGPELPYSILRLGNGYELRRYPSYSAVKMEYERRDEAFSDMGSFTSGMNPMAPALIEVQPDKKTMMWPLEYAAPGQDAPPENKAALQKAAESDATFEIVTIPASVVAIRTFSDAIVEPVVRRVDRELREVLQRDGLVVSGEQQGLTFAQYDAVFSMGKRRSEVQIRLQDGGHPY